MLRKSCLGLLLLLLGACSPLEGEAVDGLLIGSHQFVATDGRVYDVADWMPEHEPLAGIAAPSCLRLDASFSSEPPDEWGRSKWTVHRVISDRAPQYCHFETQVYRGFFYRPFEGAYFFTDPASVVEAGWPEVWAVMGMDGNYALSSDVVRQFGRNPPLRICIEVEAIASQEGMFNHLGSSKRQLTVIRVIRMWPRPPLPPGIYDRYSNPHPSMVVPEEVEGCLRD